MVFFISIFFIAVKLNEFYVYVFCVDAFYVLCHHPDYEVFLVDLLIFLMILDLLVLDQAKMDYRADAMLSYYPVIFYIHFLHILAIF